MKKILVLAAAAMFALCACETETPVVDGSGTNTENTGNENNGNENTGNENTGNENTGNEETPDTPKLVNITLNELSGADKFIELYNPNEVEVSVEGFMLVKYDAKKDGGKSTTWTGAAGMKIAAKGYLVLESSDLSDPAEDGDPDYAYESANHVFKGGLSGKKNLKIELCDASEEVIDSFARGEEGAGWNQVSGFENNKKNTFSRVPDGTGEWAYAAPTKGAANGEKTGDIEQEPTM